MIPSVDTTRTPGRGALLCVLGLALLGAAMGGCRGDRSNEPPRRFFPDMDHQPKIKAQSESEFFEDGQSARQPVPGTVPFGPNSVLPGEGETEWTAMRIGQRDITLKDDETFYFGLVEGSLASETPRYVERMPVEITEEMIAVGAEQFNIYCSMCHGYDALGNNSGTVGRLMNVRPVNLLEERYRDREGEFGSDGYMFHVIREGLWSPDGTNRMPPYGHAVNESEAWAIVAYIRVLQAAFDVEGNPAGENTNQDADSATTNDGGEG